MKAVFDPRQRAHDPQGFLVAGTPRPSPEQPARVDALLAGVAAAGAEPIAAADYGRAPIAAVHTAEYLDFLETAHALWRETPGASAEVVPNVHLDRARATYPASVVGRAGWHQADLACPIGPRTWESAWWSAQSALTGAELIREGERLAYALCRPPGHHAYADAAGGFCFLNNTAIAAERLTRAGRRVAVLDVDVHHGNGTQGIFYARGDVLTVSVHGDPHAYYPFMQGHAHERGEGPGAGANLNLPLARGTGDGPWLAAVEAGLARIRAFGADTLVVALGLDAFAGDPLAFLAVTAEGFRACGARVAGAGLATLLVQEGGYLSDDLGANLAAFLAGVEGG